MVYRQFGLTVLFFKQIFLTIRSLFKSHCYGEKDEDGQKRIIELNTILGIEDLPDERRSGDDGGDFDRRPRSETKRNEKRKIITN